MAPSTAIAVHVRLRPATAKDGTYNPESIILSSGDDTTATVSVLNPQDQTQRLKFTLDAVHPPSSTQEQIFSPLQSLISQVYSGINTTIFAYGVTGSGKTHTMQGVVGGKGEGVIPRVVKSIFMKKARLRKSELKISFSYVEILCEEIYDLLVPRSHGKKLDIRTTATGENVVADLSRLDISSVAEFEGLYSTAAQGRKTASTNLNSTSSRSHAILTLYVETTELDSGKTFLGKICLVDLAGSEDNNLTGNDPQRMRESSAINKSLTNLGSVVEALNKGIGRVPYRDSKLTRILQDALGGSSQGMLILNLAPGEKYAKDTLRTLKFATRTREVENRVLSNERDIRANPLPHFSAPTRPTTIRQALPLGRASDPAGNATAGPSRPSKPPASVAQGVQKAMSATAGGKSKGVEISEEDLNVRIEEMVKKVWEEKERGKVVVPSVEEKVDKRTKVKKAEKEKEQVKQDPVDTMSEAEKKERAKVLVNHARDHQDRGDVEGAVRYYKQARVYIPENKKLPTRIAELELAIEGQVPIPQRSTHPKTAPSDPPAPLIGMKRSKAPSRPLAELTNLAAYEADEEFGVKAKGKGKGKVVESVEKLGRSTAVAGGDKENVGGGAGEGRKKRKLVKYVEEGEESDEGSGDEWKPSPKKVQKKTTGLGRGRIVVKAD